MCGIAGLITLDNATLHRALLKKMTDVIEHRGPDGEGHWIDEQQRVGLGHRRLSIIDLSHEADQPMHYLNRYSLVFNGEIYNYLELKEDLKKAGYSFSTQSDTEVLMALYDQLGPGCLGKLDGMFAFALFDKKEQKVFCARDRFGEKPFFYHHQPGHSFSFGSEMKCLWAAGLPKTPNQRMYFNYLAYGFLDNPQDPSETFFTGCTRLPHAHSLTLDVRTLQISIQAYYDIHWQPPYQKISVEDASEQFRSLMLTSVKRRLRSDVPLGSSLSGGLDSSLVVCLIDQMKAADGPAQNTFSAVFPGFKKDERRFMDLVIAQTRINPHFTTPDEEGLLQDLDKLCYHQEEPFGSASIYAQYCVMKLAKQHNITVLLDGQGADEILAGYHGYYLQYFQELRKKQPSLYQTETEAYQKILASNTINTNAHHGWRNRLKNAALRHIPGIRVGYEHYKQYKSPFFDKSYFGDHVQESFHNPYFYNSLNEALYTATFRRGLQELLRYADRNSMAHSREVRLPFLSHELVDFLFSLPPDLKIRNGWTKWLMRESYSSLLPQAIAWRTDKIGYEPPQKSWMEKQAVKDRITEARQQLVKQRILSNKVLEKDIVAEDSNVSRGNFWRILMLNQLGL